MDTLIVNLLVLIAGLLIFNTLWLIASAYAQSIVFRSMQEKIEKLLADSKRDEA